MTRSAGRALLHAEVPAGRQRRGGLAAFIPLQVWLIAVGWVLLGIGVHVVMRRAGS